MKFTKGPWRVEEEIDGVYHGSKSWVKGVKNTLVCKTTNQTRCHLTPTLSELQANAKLIAASPTMFELLKEITEHMDFRESVMGGKDTMNNKFKDRIDVLITKLESDQS